MTSSSAQTLAEGLPGPLQGEVARYRRALADAPSRWRLEQREDEALYVWAASPFVAKLCLASPEVLAGLIDSGDLDRSYESADIAERLAGVVAERDDFAGLQQALRQCRQRELLRIAWRDLSGAAGLEATLAELTALAESCVEHALEWCQRELTARHGVARSEPGEPQQMVVLGMGKLGGGELNFSSDIDLLLAYPEDGRTDGERALDNHQFFVRLAQRLIKALSEVTAEGFVFRVDTRLRPFGEDGPLALSFDAMETYYQRHGRDWERYALTKARVVAGDRAAGAALWERLRPFVYRRYLDFGAFDALRDMKALIDQEVGRRALADNVKLGPGGIREIEFIAQAFQLVRGGQEPALQAQGILAVLERLGARNILPANAVEALRSAYAFLRRVENRLQMVDDQQTHSLPKDAAERARLAFATGYADWDAFASALEGYRKQVRTHFERVVAAPQIDSGEAAEGAPHPELLRLWQGRLERTQAVELLSEAGFDAPQQALEALTALRDGRALAIESDAGRERMDQLMPLLIAAVGRSAQPAVVLTRTLGLVEAILRRSVYLALLAEHPIALSQLVKLAAASPWIAEELRRHPILLDELLDPRELYAPRDRHDLGAALAAELDDLDPLDLEAQMDRLRRFKQANVLRVAAADVMGVLPLMKVSDQLTWVAEAILERALDTIWRQLVARYGRPRCVIDGEPYAPGFAIVAYGKLGGIELGYGSDLDLVFLHDSAGDAQATDGERSVDNAAFFLRLGQRLIHALTALTSAGVLYEVDSRLRPSGQAGLLVSSLTAFDRYQRRDAWTWEHQALVRARAVAGDAHIGERFRQIRHDVLTRRREPAELRREVRDMRARMRRELDTGGAARLDLKQGRGGIADIEFMVQYATLAWASEHPSLTQYTDNIRILDGLAACGVLAESDAASLQDVYRSYRDRVHALSLQEQPAVVAAEAYSEQRAEVQRLWGALLEEASG